MVEDRTRMRLSDRGECRSGRLLPVPAVADQGYSFAEPVSIPWMKRRCSSR
ncbi:hypothetical protein SAMN05421870_106128 [Streptomyces qinglanensis]|uniref:Uncharacterized protein n=1 Tax=Streptomyces qinglanensis TaxID=943816 RepID=A0A1H9TGV4_9ACTN|nr:hypothetical protein SAMN05421870_106128 [Streptomyces qinglanensis]